MTSSASDQGQQRCQSSTRPLFNRWDQHFNYAASSPPKLKSQANYQKKKTHQRKPNEEESFNTAHQ